MKKSFLSVTAAILVLGLELGAGGAAHVNQKSSAAGVLEAAQKMARDLQNRDADSVLALYGRREEFVHIENGKEIPWSALEPQVRMYLGSIKKNDISWVGTPKVLILGPESAVVFGAHRFGGDQTHAGHLGEWTGVFQLIDGQWKLVHSHSSDERH
jgi:hypothetical protein